MRLSPSAQLPLFGGLSTDPDMFDVDYNLGYDIQERFRFLSLAQIEEIAKLRAWIAQQCRKAGFGRTLYADLAQSFEEAICGPTQDRLLDTRSKEDLLQATLPTLPWIKLRGKPRIHCVSSSQIDDYRNAAFYRKTTEAGKLGEWFRRYSCRGMDPLRTNHNLGMSVFSVVQGSRWHPDLHETVSELLLGGLRFFPHKVEHWDSISTNGSNAQFSVSAAKRWRELFGLLSEGDVPAVVSQTTLVVVSPSLSVIGG